MSNILLNHDLSKPKTKPNEFQKKTWKQKMQQVGVGKSADVMQKLCKTVKEIQPLNILKSTRKIENHCYSLVRGSSLEVRESAGPQISCRT